MSDPSQPKLRDFKFSKAEKIATRWALTRDEPWTVDKIKKSKLSPVEQTYVATIRSLKKRIKVFHLDRQHHCCCYCGVNLRGRNIEQDREHIVPKAAFKQLSFAIFNLAIACKTCNMSVKNSRTRHLRGYKRGGLSNPRILLSEDNYNIVHPNIHDWDKHIDFWHIQSGRKSLCIHYTPITIRGHFTYYFFYLDEREVFENTEQQRRIKGAQPLHPKIVEIRKKFHQ